MINRGQDRQQVAWDLETTGFAWSDQITVSGFWFPGPHTELVVNTDGCPRCAEGFEAKLEAVSGGVSVSVTVAEDEQALLEEMRQILFERFDKQYNRLVAYNAESWKSGFDLPFLRTRCFQHNFDWLFDGIQFADLWDPVKKRLNTTYTAHGKSIDVNTLVGAHELLFEQTDPSTLLVETKSEHNHPWYRTDPYDPFEDSGRAVSSYKDGEFLPILQHNLADVHRTWELGELVRAFVSSKDITTKKL